MENVRYVLLPESLAYFKHPSIIQVGMERFCPIAELFMRVRGYRINRNTISEIITPNGFRVRYTTLELEGV